MAAMGMMGAPMPDPMGGGVPAAPSTAVDLGGMGMPPTMAPTQDDLIMGSLQAVLGKWAGGQAQIAGEKDSLLQALMQLAGAQPPSAPEAFAEGGAPTNFGMGMEGPVDPMGAAY